LAAINAIVDFAHFVALRVKSDLEIPVLQLASGEFLPFSLFHFHFQFFLPLFVLPTFTLHLCGSTLELQILNPNFSQRGNANQGNPLQIRLAALVK